MTLQSLNFAMRWPRSFGQPDGTPALSAKTTIDAAGEYEAIVICAREAMVISHVGFKPGAATGSPTADIRIETLDTATGLPSGTLWAANTNIVTGTLTTSFGLHALTASATIAAGQWFVVKIAYNSGTSFRTSQMSNYTVSAGLPYYVINTGTPTKTVMLEGFSGVLGSSATTFYNIEGLFPVSALTTSTFNNTSSARRGLRFKVPFKTRCVGLTWHNGASVGDVNVGLFDDAGSELSSSLTAMAGNAWVAAAGGTPRVYFDNPVTILPDTWYRAALEPSSATNISITTAQLPSANYRSGMPGGLNHHYTTFASGSWTDSATDQIPLLDILIDQLDAGKSPRAQSLIGFN